MQHTGKDCACQNEYQPQSNQPLQLNHPSLKVFLSD
jgi:hypothetical protein